MPRFREFFYFLAGALWILSGAAVPGNAQGRRPAVIREIEASGVEYLSLDDVAETVGASLETEAAAKRVDFKVRTHHIQFFIDSDKVVTNGESSPLDARTFRNARGVWTPKSYFASGPLAKVFRERIDLGPEAAVKPAVAAAPASAPVMEPVEEPLPPVPAKPSAKPAEEMAEPSVPEPAAPHAIRRIVIDPGHGGKDPGALGVRGTMEKNVTLWMARELADALREKDFEVLLTRMDDTFVPLASRTALANKHKADLFISVHCNASLSAKLNGFEVYFQSEKASNSHAEAVARQENASLEFEGKKPSNEVQAVLQSLAQNAKINQSAQLGAIIDREVSQQLSQADLGVKQAAFFVLRGAGMPAVLLEIGFLTNKKEERLLEDPAHRKKLIKAIESSIVEFDRRQKDAQKKRRSA